MSDNLEYRIIKFMAHHYPGSITDLGLSVGLRESQNAINRAVIQLIRQGFLVEPFSGTFLYNLTRRGWARFTRDRNSAKLELLTAFS